MPPLRYIESMIVRSYKSVDDLWLEAVKLISKNKSNQGICARLDNPLHSFLWNTTRDMKALKACAELLFLFDFSYDANFIQTYSPKTKVVDGRAINSFGPHLRPQLAALIETLREDPESDYAILSPWEGLNSQHLGYFKDYEGAEPNHLISVQFKYDGDRLNVFLNYRTVDLWELPYDVFIWSNILSIVGGFCLLPIGFVQVSSPEATLPKHIDTNKVIEGYSFKKWQRPLKINNLHLFEIEDPIGYLEWASCLEEIMRCDFTFDNSYTDLLKFVPFSSLSNCLCAIYVRYAITTLESIPTKRSRRIERVGRLIKVLGDSNDIRLLQKVALDIGKMYSYDIKFSKGKA